MNWTDEGLLLESTSLGEKKLILHFLTHHHGRQSGIIERGPLPFLNGSLYWIDWNSRLSEGIGNLKLESTQNLRRNFNGTELNFLFQIIIEFLTMLTMPKDPHPRLYEASIALLEKPAYWPNILAAYCKWELELLKELGFGLSLEKCAVTRETSNLTYVSPKSASAVSALAGQAYKDKLLKLPKFLIQDIPVFETQDLIEGLNLTGYFLEHKVFSQLGKEFPESRKNIIQYI